MPRAATAFERQARLRAVLRLDLRLLIAAQHQRMLGRIEVKPDDVFELVDEMGSLEACGSLQKASKRHFTQGSVYAQHRSDGVYHRAHCRDRCQRSRSSESAVTLPESLRSRSSESAVTLPESLRSRSPECRSRSRNHRLRWTGILKSAAFSRKHGQGAVTGRLRKMGSRNAYKAASTAGRGICTALSSASGLVVTAL